ncbi:MAG: hypothetical protein K6A30_07980 [Lachnospiraceae bacterium]|nr:hypothetical protein [Lachnospiraceae bacterium]
MEKDLFLPIKTYFENYGYTCDGEVSNIDLYMEKEDISVAVELKVSLDFKAVQQAALRQKITDYVFIGIFMPKSQKSTSFKDKLYLLNRLGIGLIAVSKRTGRVEILCEPVVKELSSYQKRNGKKKAALAAEFSRRKVKSNTGGVTHTKIITVYREDALLVLNALQELGGTATSKEVRERSGIKKATAIMRDNYYGWFGKVSRGVYSLTEEGSVALKEYESTLRSLRGAD